MRDVVDFLVCYTGRPANSVHLSFIGDARLDHLVKLESIISLHFTISQSKLWCDNLRLLAPNMFYPVVLASIDDVCLHLLLHWGLQNDDSNCHSVFVFFFNFIYLFIYFWLCWVSVAAHRFYLVVGSGGYSSLRCTGFSLRWLLLLRSMGSRRTGFSSCGTRAQ